jgi:Flp pilus assembly protein TadB
MEVEDDDFKGRAIGDVAERALAGVAEQRIIQREKTKRFLIAVVCFLFVAAVLAVLFAPPGKEIMGYALGATLIVLAMGSIGASKFLLKVPGASIDTHVRGDRNGRMQHVDIHQRIDER